MTKRLTRSGNSLALVIDRPLLEALEIDAERSSSYRLTATYSSLPRFAIQGEGGGSRNWLPRPTRNTAACFDASPSDQAAIPDPRRGPGNPR